MNPYIGCFVELYRGRYYVCCPDSTRIGVAYRKRGDAEAYLARLVEMGRGQ